MSIRNRWWAALIVVLGALQAWDSGVLRAPAMIQALVALAIVTPPAVLLLTNAYGVQALSVAASFILLTIARVISPVPLPTLHIIAFIPAILIFLTKTTEQTTKVAR
jgi:hypothetical protein